ncbi:MAG: glycosyltransferase family 39 protein [Acidobacteriota bacterium]|nr:glycosyltransferase family 39 protein [Acidobacteriota bacterium]
MTRPRVRPQSYLLVYTCIAAFLLLIHEPLLQLPYYWDELGQFIPASLDLFGTGAWIPHSTLPNVHPPGVMAYLAAFWHVFGYSIAGTRVAMLLVAAAGALLSFLLAIELARGTPQTPAFAALALLCVSPLFVAQSMLAQLDMPAMCLTLLALLLFLQDRWRDSALACVALVLVKETGVVAPALFGGWLLMERRWRDALWYLLPVIALCGWLFMLKRGTGHWFGNQSFTQYNLYYPLNPMRLGLALLRRLYFLFIGGGHFIGTIVLVYAWRRMPVFRDRTWRVTWVFLALHTVLVSALGGAVLERYLLPVLPVVYIAFAISFGALLPRPRVIALAILMLCLVAANFINPIYPFPLENNLAFVSFVNLQENAAAAVEGMPGTLATSFPMADAFRRPEFGFVSQPREVQPMEGFRAGDIARLAGHAPDVMIVFDTTWQKRQTGRSFLSPWLRRYYGYDPALPPDEIATRLSMRIARRWELHGLSMSLLERR